MENCATATALIPNAKSRNHFHDHGYKEHTTCDSLRISLNDWDVTASEPVPVLLEQRLYMGTYMKYNMSMGKYIVCV